MERYLNGTKGLVVDGTSGTVIILSNQKWRFLLKIWYCVSEWISFTRLWSNIWQVKCLARYHVCSAWFSRYGCSLQVLSCFETSSLQNGLAPDQINVLLLFEIRWRVVLGQTEITCNPHSTSALCLRPACGISACLVSPESPIHSTRSPTGVPAPLIGLEPIDRWTLGLDNLQLQLYVFWESFKTSISVKKK
jgi:hypothetical protein